MRCLGEVAEGGFGVCTRAMLIAQFFEGRFRIALHNQREQIQHP